MPEGIAAGQPVSRPTAVRPVVSMETAAMAGRYVPRQEKGARTTETPLRIDSKKTPDSIRRAHEESVRLETFDKSQGDAEATIRRAAESGATTRQLSPAEMAQLKRVNPTMADEVRQFDVYSSVVEATRGGRTEGDIIAERVKAGTLQNGEYEAASQAVVDRMVGMQYFRDTIPGFDQMKPDQQRAYVRECFANNDRIRAAYLRNVREVVRRAATEMPSDQGVAHTEQIAARGKVLTEQRTDAIGRMHARLEGKGQKVNDTDIEDAFKGGRTPEEIRLSIFDKALSGNGVDPVQYHAREAYRAQATELEARIASIDAQLKSKPGNRAELEASRLKLQGELSAARGKADAIQLNEDVITATVDNVYGVQDRNAGNIRVGGILEDIRAVSQNNADRQRLDAEQNAGLNAEQTATEEQRTLLQEELAAELQGAMLRSISEVHIQQHAEQVDTLNRKIQADQAEHEAQGKTRLAAAEGREIDQMNHNWIGFDADGRRRTVNVDQIAHDIRYIAQHGFEGVKRLMLRDMMAGGEGALIKIAGPDGKPMTVTIGPDGRLMVPSAKQGEDPKPYTVDIQVRQEDGTYLTKNVDATWENVPMERLVAAQASAELTGEQLKGSGQELLDQLYEAQGTRFADRLMTDFDLARHPTNIKESWHVIGTLKKLHLKEDEMRGLYQHFGDRYEQAIEKSEEIRHVVDRLREKGAVPPKGMEWLMFLLMLLGGGLRGEKKKDHQ